MIIPCDDPVIKGAQRFEIFTGAGKRRDWPPEVKASIVAECYAGNRGVGAVARRHGLDPS
jgi:transposase